jgi:hypothetical protein
MLLCMLLCMLLSMQSSMPLQLFDRCGLRSLQSSALDVLS